MNSNELAYFYKESQKQAKQTLAHSNYRYQILMIICLTISEIYTTIQLHLELSIIMSDFESNVFLIRILLLGISIAIYCCWIYLLKMKRFRHSSGAEYIICSVLCIYFIATTEMFCNIIGLKKEIGLQNCSIIFDISWTFLFINFFFKNLKPKLILCFILYIYSVARLATYQNQDRFFYSKQITNGIFLIFFTILMKEINTVSFYSRNGLLNSNVINKIINSAPECLMIMNLQGKIEFINQQFTTLIRSQNAKLDYNNDLAGVESLDDLEMFKNMKPRFDLNTYTGCELNEMSLKVC